MTKKKTKVSNVDSEHISHDDMVLFISTVETFMNFDCCGISSDKEVPERILYLFAKFSTDMNSKFNAMINPKLSEDSLKKLLPMGINLSVGELAEYAEIFEGYSDSSKKSLNRLNFILNLMKTDDMTPDLIKKIDKSISYNNDLLKYGPGYIPLKDMDENDLNQKLDITYGCLTLDKQEEAEKLLLEYKLFRHEYYLDNGEHFIDNSSLLSYFRKLELMLADLYRAECLDNVRFLNTVINIFKTTQADIVAVTCLSQPQVSRILTGKARITWGVANSLSNLFNLHPQLFVSRL
jgi:hypothetical protein